MSAADGNGDSRLRQHARLASEAAAADSVSALMTSALPLLADLAGAAGATLARCRPDGYEVRARTGLPFPQGALDGPLDGSVQPAPADWQAIGFRSVARHAVADGDTVFTFGWHEDAPDTGWLAAAFATIGAGVARLRAHEELTDLVARVDNAQRLANMGDYDWHIATDTNRWSDQLFRIYGYEPGEIDPNYDRFLSLIHPDDRERIEGIHQRAYASGDNYEMIERIVRPDGQVRYLSSNGQVVQDEHGTPIRMRGTCIDVTDRVRAEQAREQSAARFRSLVEACPQAILVFDATNRIVQANGRAATLLRGDPLGRDITAVLPAGWEADEGGRGVTATDLTGHRLALDVETAPLSNVDEENLVAVFLTDATARLHNERLVVTLREADLRRRQALELNDNVVQGLSAALFSLTAGETFSAESYLDRTLTAARRMMNDWLDPLHGGGLQAGDLVRDVPSTIGAPGEPSPAAPAAGAAEVVAAPVPTPVSGNGRLPTVVVVDDNDDVRNLLALQVRATKRFTVVGLAGDGEQAVAMAAELQPDIVLLDLSMPRMDGLQALPLIREASPDSRVVVMSGFDAEALAEKALAAGAVCYLEKGVRTNMGAVLDGAMTPA